VGTTLRSWNFQALNKGNHDSTERSVLVSDEFDALQVFVPISLGVQVIKKEMFGTIVTLISHFGSTKMDTCIFCLFFSTNVMNCVPTCKKPHFKGSFEWLPLPKCSIITIYHLFHVPIESAILKGFKSYKFPEFSQWVSFKESYLFWGTQICTHCQEIINCSLKIWYFGVKITLMVSNWPKSSNLRSNWS